MTVLQLLTQGDFVSRSVAMLLLAMSIASWLVILWKVLLLRTGTRDVIRSIAAFWQSASVGDAQNLLFAYDRARLVLPTVDALADFTVSTDMPTPTSTLAPTLAGRGEPAAQLTRALRDALHGTLRRLQAGQILLATIGATAPFIGLLGTVWGIFNALTAIAQQGAFTIDKVAGPVGEALVMTAAGLAVAIPAVLAYNVLGRAIGRIEGELEGFAHDLLAQFAPPPAPASSSASDAPAASSDLKPVRARPVSV